MSCLFAMTFLLKTFKAYANRISFCRCAVTIVIFKNPCAIIPPVQRSSRTTFEVFMYFINCCRESVPGRLFCPTRPVRDQPRKSRRIARTCGVKHEASSKKNRFGSPPTSATCGVTRSATSTSSHFRGSGSASVCLDGGGSVLTTSSFQSL